MVIINITKSYYTKLQLYTKLNKIVFISCKQTKSLQMFKRTRDVDEITEENENENNQELLTTLMIHLFGKYGTGSVTFDQFFK